MINPKELPKLKLEDLKEGMHVHYEQVKSIYDVIIVLKNFISYGCYGAVEGDIAYIITDYDAEKDTHEGCLEDGTLLYRIYNGSTYGNEDGVVYYE